MALPTTGAYVTGWSTLSPFGVGRESFVDGLCAGRSGQLPEPEPSGPPPAGYPVPDFEPARLLAGRSIRTLDRMTLMVIAASGMLLDGRDRDDTGTAERGSVGLVLGTSTGSLASITDFLKDTFVREKPYFVDPAAFPNTVMNGPAGRTAIWHGLRGLNSTISGGHATGLEALRYAARMIRRGYAETLVVGSVEELSAPVGWAAGELRAGASTPLGEGCVMFLLRGAGAAGGAAGNGAGGADRFGAPLAELVDFEFGVVPWDADVDTRAVRLAEAIRLLLGRTGIDPADLWLVSLAQSGDGELDEAERAGVDQGLGTAGAEVRRIAVSQQVGNSFSALAGFQVAGVLAMAERETDGANRPSLVTTLGADGAVGCAVIRTC
jgi:3-oxoacyl-[acyl-carrier-protein] synthase II